MTPIFLLSQPRAGSTLLQRKLSEHRDIASVDEPWILLPLLLARHEGMVTGVHDQTVLVRALQDFCDQLPDGQRDWDAAVRQFAHTLYARSCPEGTRYFLDKTPRYTLAAQDLIRTFPEARFIILWRDPMSVVHSINDTWGGGRWAVHRHEVDVYAGLEGLCDAADLLGERAFTLRYEDLTEAPEAQLAALYEWLGLAPKALLPEQERQAFSGQMGDPKRHGDGGKVQAASGKMGWRQAPLTPARRRWMRRYLDWIGPERMARMGYDLASWQADLAAVPGTSRGQLRDMAHLAFATLYRTVNYPVVRQKLKNHLQGRRNFVQK
ncbi:sulfotransferase [Aliiroseovarius sp.]|uniref:sulfotransferase family protein n=1 Tax=Aliiroseovarius sp. TaxID=1872442 RepID=UPI0026038B90|nr:sulfotransferase [Aliiroseovarius sp.]